MIKVVLIDDDALVRAGLRTILSSAGDIDVVGEADDGSRALELVRRARPDVAVVDIRMPILDGIEATRLIRAEPDPPKVLVLTTFQLDKHVFAAIEAGANGFLLKDTPPLELIEAVRVVAAGDAMLSPAHTRALMDRYSASGREARRAAARELIEELSPREVEVAKAVAEGLSNAEIGALLACAEATVKAHLSHIFTKTGDTNRVRLALLVRDAEV